MLKWLLFHVTAHRPFSVSRVAGKGSSKGFCRIGNLAWTCAADCYQKPNEIFVCLCFRDRPYTSNSTREATSFEWPGDEIQFNYPAQLNFTQNHHIVLRVSCDACFLQGELTFSSKSWQEPIVQNLFAFTYMLRQLQCNKKPQVLGMATSHFGPFTLWEFGKEPLSLCFPK